MMKSHALREELRQLTTTHEREMFENYLTQARATRGVGFGETAHSRLGNAHLPFGDLHGLLVKEGEPAEKMMAGCE